MRPILPVFVVAAVVAACGTPVEDKGPSCEDLGCVASGRECAPVFGKAACGPCLVGFLETAGVCVKDKTCADLACADASRVCQGFGHNVTCGACVTGFADTAGQCVKDKTCDDLDCAGQHKACAGTGPNVTCAACLDGFKASGDTCVAKSCDDLGCAAANRKCDAVSGGTFACGTCVDKYVELNLKCEPCKDVDADGICDNDDTCLDKDGDGVGIRAGTGCATTALDSDDADPKVCGSNDGDGCDDCASGHFDEKTDCCEALPTLATAAPSLWIDAACETTVTAGPGAIITALTDRSGHQVLTPQGSIAYGTTLRRGRRVLSFDGSMVIIGGDVVGRALVEPHNFAVFAVQFYDPDPIGITQGALVGWDTGSTRLVIHAPWTNGLLFFDSADPVDAAGRISVLPGPSSTPLRNWRQITALRRDAAAQIRVDGTTLVRSTTMTTFIDDTQTTGLRVASGLVGHLAELLIVKGPMTDAERDAVELSLRLKWQTAAPPN